MASASSPPSKKQEKQDLGWMEWLKGWYDLIFEACFQKLMSRHLHNPLPLPSLNGKTCIVTGSTSGIGLEIARQLAESGAHVVMAVRNPVAANELIQKWQNRRTDSDPLNIDVMELDLLSLESVARFSESWNSRGKPLNVLINNAGIFSIGEPHKFSRDGYERHMQVAYQFIPFFLFTALEGSRSALFAATDPEILKYSEKLKSEEWPVCAYISYNCRPMNPSKEAHNVNTSHIVWEKTLEMVGLPSNIVETSMQ
ncbi:hypothetical protein RJ640_021369 [Escallonia rubra]|uniref:Uncharacterized protein n=1 Tax=Escallonia rubra TaxID=112253 RepID=A0AA88RBT1_9ASTE|nr:hypothetical protein RJ640_021369 [Escallonia rubra]